MASSGSIPGLTLLMKLWFISIALPLARLGVLTDISEMVSTWFLFVSNYTLVTASYGSTPFAIFLIGIPPSSTFVPDILIEPPSRQATVSESSVADILVTAAIAVYNY